MVHVFHYQDKHYIFDTGSSSLHECDEKTARCLRHKLGESVDLSDISEEEISAAEVDFDELMNRNSVYKKEEAGLTEKHICRMDKMAHDLIH